MGDRLEQLLVALVAKDQARVGIEQYDAVAAAFHRHAIDGELRKAVRALPLDLGELRFQFLDAIRQPFNFFVHLDRTGPIGGLGNSHCQAGAHACRGSNRPTLGLEWLMLHKSAGPGRAALVPLSVTAGRLGTPS